MTATMIISMLECVLIKFLFLYYRLDVPVSVISTVEQQSQHVEVPQAVLQGRGEPCVADHTEVTIHVCSVGNQQLHQIIPGKGETSEVAATAT